MNWARGALRVFIVVTVLWVLGFGLAAYDHVWFANRAQQKQAYEQEICFAGEKAKGKAGNIFNCFDDAGQPRFEKASEPPSYWPYILIALGGPLGMLILWKTGSWLVAGFRTDPV